MELTRRRLLSVTAATAGTGVLAGCTGDGSTAGSEPDGTTAQASFFVFGDLTDQVAGEAATADLLVPIGQHGHGWEPGPSVREDIRDADLFVHGMIGFQPWVDDIKTDLEADGSDVATVDVSAGLDLLEAGEGHDHGHDDHDEDHDEEHDDDHDEEHGTGEDLHVEHLQVRHAEDGEIIAEVHDDHWDGERPSVPHEGELTVEIHAENDEGDEIHFDEGSDHELHVRVEDESVLDVNVDGETVEFHGHGDGETEVVFEIHHDGHVKWESPHWPVVVGDDEDEHDEEQDEEHDHGSGMDPHFWMDPLRVKEATGNVRQGLVDVDPDNADTYAENAEAFRSELDGLHEQMEELVADASKSVILVAGHDSLQYFGDRYGVTVEALTNVSPDDRPTPRDIERAQEVIETHGLEYICADPLESQQAADQLVEETDAKEVLPLTAMPGLTDEWESEDWGYVDVMENVNLPTLERALDA